MKKKKPIIRLLVFIVPVFIQFSCFAQGAIKAESGARIVSQTGSYWVIDNGNMTLASPSATYPVSIANLTITNDGALKIPALQYLTVAGTVSNGAGNTGILQMGRAFDAVDQFKGWFRQLGRRI